MSIQSPTTHPTYGEIWEHGLGRYWKFLQSTRETDLDVLADSGMQISNLTGWAWMDHMFRTWMLPGTQVGICGRDTLLLTGFLQALFMRYWLCPHPTPLPLGEVPRVAWINTSLREYHFCDPWVRGLALIQSPEAWVGNSEKAQSDSLALAVESLKKVPLFPVHQPLIRPVDLIEEATAAATELGANTLVVDGLPVLQAGGWSSLWDPRTGEYQEAIQHITRTLNMRVIRLLPDPFYQPGPCGHRLAHERTHILEMFLLSLLSIQPREDGEEGVQVDIMTNPYYPIEGTKLAWREALHTNKN